MSKQKLSFPTKILILDNILCKIFSVFTGIFLSAYFYQISEEYVFQLALYNVAGWIIATFGAIFLADIIKRKDKIWIYRIGIVIKMLFAFMILILGQNITDHVISLGVMYGLMVATNGFPFNMIESENITNRERIKYLGFGNALTGIVSIIAPILIGRYITEIGYSTATLPIIVLTIIELLVSFFLKSKNKTTNKLNLGKFFKIFKKDKTLQKLYLIEFFKGINRHGVMELVASLIIIRVLPSVIAMILFAKFYRRKKQNLVVVLSTIIIGISTVSIIVFPTFISIIAYNISCEVFLHLIEKISTANLFDYSTNGEYRAKYNTEYFTYRELFLNAGRIIGYLALLILAVLGIVSDSLNIMFVIIIISIIATSGLILATKIPEKN